MRVGSFDGGATQKVVSTDMVEISQSMDGGNRDVESSQFIVGIGSLMNIQ